MPTQLCLDLLVPLSASVSTAGSIQPGGDSCDSCKLDEVNPSVIHLMPYDEANWQSLIESAGKWAMYE